MRRFIPIIVLCIAAAAIGQSRLFPEPPPTNPPAQNNASNPGSLETSARERYDAAAATAKAAYQSALFKAEKDYIADLDAALKSAMSAQDINAVRRIDAERQAAATELAKLSADAPASSATKIIYVCQGSGALVGGKDEAMRRQVKASIQGLNPSQSFNFLLFQESDKNRLVVQIYNQLVPSTPDNKEKVFSFIDNKLTFHGNSFPIQGIEEAFREQPQVIYFYTAGNFDDKSPNNVANISARIKQLNVGHHVVVNVILLNNKRGDNEIPEPQRDGLKKLASDNGGIYLAICGEDAN